MMRKFVFVIFVAVIAVAGVTTGIVSAAQHDSHPPVTLPQATSEEVANDTVEYPPGASEDGIENVTQLIKAHHSVLNNSTYQGQVERNLVSRYLSPTGFEVVPVAVNISSEPGSTRICHISEGVVNEYWLTENSTASKLSFGSQPQFSSYQYHNIGSYPIFHTTAGLHDWFNDTTYDYTGTLTRDNRTLHEYWVTGLRGNESNLVDAHARVLISPEGVVHKVIGTRTYNLNNEMVTGRLQYTIQLSETGPTQPEWVTTELPQLDSSLAGNGTVIALEHTGGMTISNASIDAFFPDVKVAERDIEDFEPGETLYLYRVQTAPEQLIASKNVPTVNESFVPVGGDFVFVSVFDNSDFFTRNNTSSGRVDIELEPRER